MTLIQSQQPERCLTETFDASMRVPEESVWLANFMSERTRSTYEKTVNEFARILGISNSEQLYAVTTAHVIVYRQKLVKLGRSNRTIASRLAALSSLYQHLADRQCVAVNPVAAVKRPRVSRGKVSAGLIPAEQVCRLLALPGEDSIKGLRDGALLHLYFYSGCRLAEAVTLRVRDFDRRAPGGPCLSLQTKGQKDIDLYVGSELSNALTRYLDAAGHAECPDQPLIQPLCGGGRTLTSRQAGRIFHEYAEQVGLSRNIATHAARATFITTALSSGISIEQVRRCVGHADISTTARYDLRDFGPEHSAARHIRY